MSSEKLQFEKKNDYVQRLVEVGGTKQPTVLAQKFGISYQAAKNYLQGRLPDTNVLLNISRRTSYSIHWILTGEGEKFVAKPEETNSLLLSEQLKLFIRQQCIEVFNELFDKQKEVSQEKIVRFSTQKIKSEKKVNSESFAVRQQDSE